MSSKPKKNNPYNTLGTCVFNAIEDIQGHENLFLHFLHFGIKAYRDYMYHIDQEVKTVEITLNQAKKAELPDDYLKWTKVGIRQGDMIYTFIRDEDLPNIFDTDSDGNETQHDVVAAWQDIAYDDSQYYTFYNYRGTRLEDEGRLFGRKFLDNHHGYFKINDCEIQINPRVNLSSTQKLYLEYIGDGLDPNKDTFVHPFAHELISLRIHWENMKNNPRLYSRGAILDAKENYYEELAKVNTRFTEWDLEEIKDSLYKGYSLTPNTI